MRQQRGDGRTMTLMMGNGRGRRRLAAAVALLAAVLPVTVRAEEPLLTIELNRLEDHDGACRSYFLFQNHGKAALAELRLDLILFGPDGIVARRLAVDAAPLRGEKTMVKLFDVAGLACAGIGSVLLNDIPACRTAEAGPVDCMAGLETRSRLPVPLNK